MKPVPPKYGKLDRVGRDSARRIEQLDPPQSTDRAKPGMAMTPALLAAAALVLAMVPIPAGVEVAAEG
jgi:hypothetical protein